MAIIRRQLKTRTNGKAAVAYLVRVDVGRDEATGKRKQVSRQVSTRREAERVEREMLRQVEHAEFVGRSDRTVNELLDAWLVSVEASGTVSAVSLEAYRSVIDRHIRPTLGHARVQRLTVDHVNRLLVDLAMVERGADADGNARIGYSSSLRAKVRMRLIQALDYAVSLGEVAKNVAAASVPVKQETQPHEVWTPAELAAFMAEARKDAYALLWTLLAETGCRISEALGLTWRHVDIDRGTLRIGAQTVRNVHGRPTLKAGGKSRAAMRTVTLIAPTVTRLRQAKDRATFAGEPPDALLFHRADGSPLDMNHLLDVHARLCQRAEVPQVGLHGMRRTAITLLIAAGADPKAVSQRVGHADAAVTLNVYQQVTAAQHEAITTTMTALLAEPDAEAAANA